MNSLILLPLCFAAAFAGAIHPYGQAVVATPYAAYAPAAAAVTVGAYGVSRTQHHSQDNYGNYDYGYAEPNSAKRETRHPDGTVTGSYSHVFADGRVLTNNYVADEHGFRSSLAPTAGKDFSPKVKAVYNVAAPVVAHSVAQYAVPQPALHLTRSVQYAAPLAAAPAVINYGNPVVRSAYAAVPAAYGAYGAYGYGAAQQVLPAAGYPIY